jgi:hypothetical protein
MDGINQIGAIFEEFVDAVIHPSMASLPMGFLVLVLAVLTVAALPEGARGKDAAGRPNGVRPHRQPLVVVAGKLGRDPALSARGSLNTRRG